MEGKSLYAACSLRSVGGYPFLTRRALKLIQTIPAITDEQSKLVEPGVTVRDIVENGRHGIEIEYRRVTAH